MKNTFHSRAPHSHRALNVDHDTGGFRVALADRGAVPHAAILLTEQDAADLAFSILLAPGPVGVLTHSHTTGTPEHLAFIASGLGRYIEARDRAAERKAENLAKLEAEVAAAEAAKAAELADLAELESLARTIYTAGAGLPAAFFVPWERLRDTARAQWINVARAARTEVRGENPSERA